MWVGAVNQLPSEYTERKLFFLLLSSFKLNYDQIKHVSLVLILTLGIVLIELLLGKMAL